MNTDKLTPPDSVIVKSKKYLDENNPIKQFMDKCVIVTRDDKDNEKSSFLYDCFVKNNDDKGKRGITPAIFKKQLTEVYGIKFKKQSDGNYYLGIKLEDNNED